MKKIYLLVVSLIFFYSNAHAEDQWNLILHTKSHHFSERAHHKQWNENNIGFGLRRDLDNNFSLQFGLYKNSINKISTYLITEYNPIIFGNFQSGLFAGIRTNYQNPIEVAGGGLLRWQASKSIDITTRISPKTCSTCSGFISIELGWKL